MSHVGKLWIALWVSNDPQFIHRREDRLSSPIFSAKQLIYKPLSFV
jgi:hypothetical protein